MHRIVSNSLDYTTDSWLSTHMMLIVAQKRLPIRDMMSSNAGKKMAITKKTKTMMTRIRKRKMSTRSKEARPLPGGFGEAS